MNAASDLYTRSGRVLGDSLGALDKFCDRYHGEAGEWGGGAETSSSP